MKKARAIVLYESITANKILVHKRQYVHSNGVLEFSGCVICDDVQQMVLDTVALANDNGYYIPFYDTLHNTDGKFVRFYDVYATEISNAIETHKWALHM